MRIDGLFRGMDISASGLMAERTMMDVTAQNLANMRTTGVQKNKDTGNWEPFRRRLVYVGQGAPSITGSSELGVRVTEIEKEQGSVFKKIYMPNHPDAITKGEEKGYVNMPNIDPAIEMVNMMVATRAYEANATAFESSKNMIARALRILI